MPSGVADWWFPAITMLLIAIFGLAPRVKEITIFVIISIELFMRPSLNGKAKCYGFPNGEIKLWSKQKKNFPLVEKGFWFSSMV